MNRQLLIVCCFGSLSLYCSAAAAEAEYQNWLTLEGQVAAVPASSSFVAYGFLQSRRGESATVGLLRAAAGYQFGTTTRLLLGGDWFAQVPDVAGDTTYEYRVWQDFQHTFRSSDDTSVGLRSRLEERFLGAGGDEGLRFRQRVLFVWDFVPPEPVFVATSVEGFFNLLDADWAAAGFDQVRLYAALGYRFTPELRIEAGYQWLAQDRSDDAFFSHSAMVSLFWIR